MSAVATKPKGKSQVGVRIRVAIEHAIARIEAEGWDPNFKHIGHYVRSHRIMAVSPLVMEHLLKFTGCSVLVWDREPGRTKADVLALLREAMR